MAGRRTRKDLVGRKAENNELAAREREIRDLIRQLRAEQKRIRWTRQAINDDTTE